MSSSFIVGFQEKLEEVTTILGERVMHKTCIATFKVTETF